jgi:hypothetical protein
MSTPQQTGLDRVRAAVARSTDSNIHHAAGDLLELLSQSPSDPATPGLLGVVSRAAARDPATLVGFPREWAVRMLAALPTLATPPAA